MKDKDRTMRSLVRNDKYLWFFRLFQEHEYLYLTNDIDGYCLWTGEPYYDTEAKCWYEAQGLDIPFRDMEKDAVDLLLGNTAPVPMNEVRKLKLTLHSYGEYANE